MFVVVSQIVHLCVVPVQFLDQKAIVNRPALDGGQQLSLAAWYVFAVDIVFLQHIGRQHTEHQREATVAHEDDNHGGESLGVGRRLHVTLAHTSYDVHNELHDAKLALSIADFIQPVVVLPSLCVCPFEKINGLKEKANLMPQSLQKN